MTLHEEYPLPWRIEDRLLLAANNEIISDYLDWCEDPDDLSFDEFESHLVYDIPGAFGKGGPIDTIEQARAGLISASFVGGKGRDWAKIEKIRAATTTD